MSTHIPPSVLAVQREASDPTASAWVSANAGSGKTHVLAQRVIRLLLAGTPPAKILCLTYTKAAAANMANRVFETLGRWTAFDDARLDQEIESIEGVKPDARRRVHARRLFAAALDTPGGLKVQTIHAFCTRLLHQFPFEADVAARFEVLEERTQSELIDRLRMTVLLQAAANPDSELGRALNVAITVAADQTFADVVGEIIGRREELVAWITAAGGIKPAIDDLSCALGVAPTEASESIAAEYFSGPLIAPSEWLAIAAALTEGSKTDKEQGARFATLARLTGTERLKTYQSIFCTADLSPRKSIVTKAIRENEPALFQRLTAEQGRVCALNAKSQAVATRERTQALITIAIEVIKRYHVEKERRGLLDYDDLINKSLALLDRTEAAWVHYKLDLGVDHMLIDEAQDTSPKQWEIVSRLTAEFTAGAGARAIPRTIFAVGDEKQSIYSFQGAAPDRFAERQRHFAGEHRNAALRFAELRFLYSFRSAPLVLNAVDTVFQRPQAFRGLSADNVHTVHEAVRAQAPGMVEIWPLIEPDDKPELEGWDAPFDETSETSPRVKLAQRIAKAVRTAIARRDRVGDGQHRRAVRPGDILVLVRQRGALFEAIIRALKQEGVAVAGADRLILTEHIAVMDLIALGDALLLPDDDLALATVLKSPLFGLNEDDIFRLAWNRKGSLRAELRSRADDDLMFATANARLDRYTTWAQHDSPFGFYARVLGAERGRAAFFARLGMEAADALDEFLEHALMYERGEAPTLQGFVAWLRAGSTEVKRDMDIARDEVRVMTVHGAKGLEAPLVILADTTTRPKGPKDPRLLALAAQAAPGTPDRLVWAGRKADDTDAVATARATQVSAAEDEYRRLLYVAMTRAADRLIVCGARGEQSMPEGCWYQLVHDALVDDAVEEPADDGTGTVWRWRKMVLHDANDDDATRAASDRTPIDSPSWLTQKAPPEPAAARTVSPSSAFDAALTRGGSLSAETVRKALARGTIVHRLLQALPNIAPERRTEAAQQHIARDKTAFTDTERQAIADEVTAVLGDGRFAPLFAHGSRAEVPIVGRITGGGRPVAVSGQVDRLVVTESEVLIADYKTNRPAPGRIGDVPQGYLVQLALYRAVLSALYPGKTVRTALIWTEGPDLMEIPAATLDATFTQFTSA